MARVKGGTVTRARRKKILKAAEGYFGSKHLLFKTAKEQVCHSLRYAYDSRRLIKRDFRKLWIKRINAACHLNGISYSKFMDGLKKGGIEILSRIFFPTETEKGVENTFRNLPHTAGRVVLSGDEEHPSDF